MARFHLRPREEKKKERPAVSDDFIYDEPEEDSSSAIASDTPEEALKKLRGGSEKTVVSEKDPEESEKTVESMQAFRKKARAASTVLLDDDLQPLPSRRKSRGSHPRLRIFFLSLVTVILVLLAAAYIFHRIIPDVPLLGEPETAVSEAVSPVQEFFSSITETVAGLFRSYKLRSNIEAEYNALRAENEQLVYKAMLADELQQTLSQYEDLSDEIAANAGMKPIVCTVIGKSDSNYFSTFTINKGTNDGVEDYMAVTISGALVGYTESVDPSSATVILTGSGYRPRHPGH